MIVRRVKLPITSSAKILRRPALLSFPVRPLWRFRGGKRALTKRPATQHGLFDERMKKLVKHKPMEKPG
jgi:hypothetical protein